MKTTILFLTLAATACVTTHDQHDTWEPLDSVTITSGVYGQTIADCPVVGTPCVVKAAPDIEVAAYEGVDLPNPTGDVPAAIVISDDRGFFEIALPAGSYRLCRGEQIDGVFMPKSCTGAATSVSGAIRVDMY